MHGRYTHQHHHPEQHAQSCRVLILAVLFTLAFAIVEGIAGWAAHSLALLSDAGHMLSDSFALMLAALAAWVATHPPSLKHSYGFGRAEIIGGGISSLLMLLVSIGIAVEAVIRFSHPHTVNSIWVMGVGALGLLFNMSVAYFLHRSGTHTLNLKAALLHVLSDLLGSFVALLSGIIIYFMGWMWIDPLLSLFIALLVLISSLRLLQEATDVLMEKVPAHLDLQIVSHAMQAIPGVRHIHDLHIWTLSSGIFMLSAHIEVEDLHQWETTLSALSTCLLKKFDINHITLQPETPYFATTHSHHN